jgi:hypothetical protein
VAVGVLTTTYWCHALCRAGGGRTTHLDLWNTDKQSALDDNKGTAVRCWSFDQRGRLWFGGRGQVPAGTRSVCSTLGRVAPQVLNSTGHNAEAAKLAAAQDLTEIKPALERFSGDTESAEGIAVALAVGAATLPDQVAASNVAARAAGHAASWGPAHASPDVYYAAFAGERAAQSAWIADSLGLV